MNLLNVKPMLVMGSLCLLASAQTITTVAAQTNSASAPIAKKTEWKEVRHGETVTDDYRWLHKKTDPEVISYLNAENAYTEAHSAPFQGLTDKVYSEVRGRMKENDLSVPVRRGSYFYYSRVEAGKQYPINCRRKANANMAYDANAAEEILLDQNEMAKGLKYFAVGTMTFSPNERFMAYSVDTNGYRQYKLQIKDLQTGEVLSDSAERVTSVAWAQDNKTLFYVQEDATTKRSDRVFRVSLGGKAQELYHEAVEQFNLYVGTTRDKKFIVMGAGSTDTSEMKLLPANMPNAKFKSVLGREKGHRYSVDHRDGQLFIMTNKAAKNFRLVSAPLAQPQQKNWKEIVKHDPDTLLTSFELFRDFLVVNEKNKALNRSRIFNFTKKSWQNVDFKDPVYLANAAGTPEFTSKLYRMSYQSPVTPPMVMDVNMETGERTVLKQQEIVGGFDSNRYETKRLWATARDGVKVPLWMVYKKGVAQDGNAPLLLYSYGSYGISTEASFSSARISLLERGVVYVQAHIRGGTDMGQKWHEDGMLMKKKNTFTDFIDSAEYLIQEKWTNPKRLIIQGGSAGGLLMGAVSNMRPDLFHAVHAAVPFVDVMNTMMDSSLPLTTGEYLEWGNPNEKAAYDYMKSYSPYDNIERKAYPTMLVTTGLNDSQVMYWEPAKYVAKLRAMKTDSNGLYLKTNMSAGHGGSSGRYDAIRENAFQMAWMLNQWGIKE